jgi:hypothetical protein
MLVKRPDERSRQRQSHIWNAAFWTIGLNLEYLELYAYMRLSAALQTRGNERLSLCRELHDARG